MMLHGYLSAVVVTHVLLGAPLPELKDEGYFLELAGRSKGDQTKHASESQPGADPVTPTEDARARPQDSESLVG
jgi:hypothetical protein